VIVLSTVKLSSHIKDQLEKKFTTITFYHDKKINEAKEFLPKADILLTYGEDLTDEHLKAALNVKWNGCISRC
jgi:phosphoglycerate dehydrogenase-like enzyme